MREEIAALLREAMVGKFEFVDETWDETYAGNCAIRVGTAVITLFNDCDSLDYVDSADLSDGRHWEYEDGPEIFALTTREEEDQLERALKAAS
jgi:probable phosphoglycerate mutase